MIDFLLEYGLVIAFYLSVILLIYFNRKKFHFEGKIIAMYKTKLGIRQMKRFATPLKNPYSSIGQALFYAGLILTGLSALALVVNSYIFNFMGETLSLWVSFALLASFMVLLTAIVFFRRVKEAGTLGIYVGFVLMFVMIGIMAYGMYMLVFFPDEPALFTPVLPGISIPGSPIKLPLIEGLLALFVVVVVHEFSHGVLSKAYKVRIKSSGLVMFGPIPGAFVEPDEQKLKKAGDKVQLSVFAAGPFSNVLLAGFVFVLMTALTFASAAMYEPTGISVTGFSDDEIAEPGGRLEFLSEGDIIRSVNDEPTRTVFDLFSILQNASPGDEVLIETNNINRTVVLDGHPDDPSRAYLGVFLAHEIQPREGMPGVVGSVKGAWFWLFGNPFGLTINQTLGLLGWIFVLSIGIGIVNLLPIGPVDGGRMYLLVLEKWLNKKTAKKIWSSTALVLVVVLAFLIFIPIIRAILSPLLA